MNFFVNVLSLLAITALLIPSGLFGAPKIKESEKTEVTLQQAITIVEKRRLTECVARTICELSCNPDAYGSDGMAVYQTLKHFESNTNPKLIYYKSARDSGLSLDKQHCNECFNLFKNCKTSTETLLRLTNALTIKP